MRKSLEWALYLSVPLLLFGIILALVKWSGITVSYADVKDYSGALLNVSGCVFTIMGIWVAYLYPDALVRITSDNITSADFSEAQENSARLKTMVGSIIISALVAMAMIYVLLGKTLIANTDFYEAHRLNIKAAAVTVVIYATLLQTLSVFYVIRSNFLFLIEFHEKRVKREREDDV
ncbi:hypothetical protein [Pseudomonas sp. S36]|uniref:hypothetical protein n=1 Tax=Pseudomonas sp. S36 TaxID=2767447 RepID=UPI001911D4EA|nr:hypothetical protein [Pseudomonas sp. S36]